MVEDELHVRRTTAEALRDLGCRVLEAGDGARGLALLRQASGAASPLIDMLVADIGLPGGLNGRQLADAARELLPGLPVLLITGYAGSALDDPAGLGAGMRLLGKPFTLDALSAQVQAALALAGPATGWSAPQDEGG
ncbi:response regulator [Lichenicoccus roseus]|uniref:response regulator n=1 Tax=Lichenicoccus roseus TaxID=2683649 RepID=UPI0038D20CB6